MKDTGLDKINYKFLIVVAIIIPVVLSISYAFFVPKAGDSGGRIISGTATQDVHFDLLTDTDGYINASNLVPLDVNQIDEYAEKGYFSVVSLEQSTFPINLTISLSQINITGNVNRSDINWALMSCSKTDTTCTLTNNKINQGTFTGTDNTNTTILLKSNLELDVQQTNNYSLWIWVENTNENQIGMLGSTISGKISVTGEYVYVQN